MTVAELLSRISSREIMEWRAFFRIEAFEMEQARGGGNSTQFRGQTLPS